MKLSNHHKSTPVIQSTNCKYSSVFRSKGKEYLVYATHKEQDIMRCSRAKPYASVGHQELE
jgi:hypothetical protein